MKNLRLSIIFACFLTGFFYISCEKSGYTNEMELTDNQRISNRTVEECEDCPNAGDCCCAIESQNPDDFITLQLCGTSDGAGACSGSAACGSSFIGGGQQITLQMGDYRKLFCMGQGNAFWIKNLSMTTPASIYLTCQHDLTAPQILSITIPANSTYYYETVNACVLSGC